MIADFRPTRRFAAAAALAAALAATTACGGDDDITNQGPVPPSAVQVTGAGTSRVRVTFDAVGGASSYRIDRAAMAGDFTQVGTVQQPAGTATVTFVDSTAGLTPETQYRYRVATIRGSATSAYSTIVTGSTLAVGSAGQAELTGVILQNRTLSADTLYTLNGYVKVMNGATLTIPAGTRLLGGAGSATTGGIGGALFVYRGARLVVNGTKELPVVFTSSRAAGSRAPGDWGGIVIVGRATTNRTGGTVLTESPGPVVNETNGAGGTQQQYNAGTDDNDNSGSLRYLRIEFAGFAVSQDNELNSLSMYAVGRGTTIEYVEALAGLDDSFEWFGGTVDGRYLVSYEAQDDHFDASEGYRGRNQFLIGYLSKQLSPNASGSAGGAATDPQFFEIDGCADTTNGTCPGGFDATPYTMPVFANFTVLGTGANNLPPNGGVGLLLRRGTGGTWVNGVVARVSGRAITVRDAATNARLTADSLSLRNLLLADNAANFDPTGTNFGQAAKFATFGVDTLPTGTSSTTLFSLIPAPLALPAGAAAFDWTPKGDAPALMRTGGMSTFAAPLAGRMAGFFGGALQGTAYRGAAPPVATDPAYRWWEGWTAYYQQ